MTEAPNVRQELTQSLAADAVAGKEAAIIDALPRAFALAEAILRCDIVVTPDKVETYRLDGRPFIEFYPPEFSSVNGPDGIKLTVTQKYRALRSAAA